MGYGKLFVVGTPIGNLSDLSPRAAQTLTESDFIAAEDTRVTLKLLNSIGVKKPLISYFEHNRREKGEYILSKITGGESCALVTDAGMPAISDPGADLVDLCLKAGVEVTTVPGPSAVITALAASGMACGRFTFEGFLSTANKALREHLQEVSRERRTMVFYEAPHKLLKTLSDMSDAFGDRNICICRELTKIHEEIRRTTLSEAIAKYEKDPPRGEFVLIIEGYAGEDETEKPDPISRALELIAEGKSLNDAVKQASRETSFPKNQLYSEVLKRTDGGKIK